MSFHTTRSFNKNLRNGSNFQNIYLFSGSHLKWKFYRVRVRLQSCPLTPLSDPVLPSCFMLHGDLISKTSSWEYLCLGPVITSLSILCPFPHQNVPIFCLILSAAGFIQCDPSCSYVVGSFNKSLIMCKIVLALASGFSLLIS